MLKKLEESVKQMLKRKRDLNKKVQKEREMKRQAKKLVVEKAEQRRFKQALRKRKKGESGESEVAWGRLRKGESKRKILKKLKKKSDDDFADSYEELSKSFEDSDDSLEDIDSGATPDMDDDTRRRIIDKVFSHREVRLKRQVKKGLS